jgi:hypothetical protein
MSAMLFPIQYHNAEGKKKKGATILEKIYGNVNIKGCETFSITYVLTVWVRHVISREIGYPCSNVS